MIEHEYALALFDLTQENTKEIKEQLSTFSEIYNDNNLDLIFNSPRIKDKEKKEILAKCLKGFNMDLLSFLYVLVDNGRINLIDKIDQEYQNFVNEKEGNLKVIVQSAKKLDDAQKHELSDFLKKKYHKNIIFDEIIDEKIVGGIRVLCNGECIDYSYKNIMNKMQSIL